MTLRVAVLILPKSPRSSLKTITRTQKTYKEPSALAHHKKRTTRTCLHSHTGASVSAQKRAGKYVRIGRSQPNEPSNLCFFLHSQSSGKTQLRSIASNTDSLMAKSNHHKQTVLASTALHKPIIRHISTLGTKEMACVVRHGSKIYPSSGTWRDQTTGSSAENDQMNHLAKGRHNDAVAILPLPHPWSSSLQGGTLKISDPAHDKEVQ